MRTIFLLCFLITGTCCVAQDLFDLRNSTVFANHLYETGQYDLASTEFERLVFLSREDDSLQVKLIRSYERSGNTARGISRIEELSEKGEEMNAEMSRIYIGLLLKNGEVSKAEDFLKQYPKLTRTEKLFYQMSASAFSSNWQKAKILVDSLEEKQFRHKPEFQGIVADAINIDYKKPLIAAALSGIVPGAGKFYTKDWKDGLISFVMFAGSGWQSYRSFRRQGSDSVRGWLFASITTGFYVGNIYGSFKAAKKYNRNLDTRNLQKFEKAFHLYR